MNSTYTATRHCAIPRPGFFSFFFHIAGDTAPLPETPLIVNYGCKPSPCSSLFHVVVALLEGTQVVAPVPGSGRITRRAENAYTPE